MRPSLVVASAFLSALILWSSRRRFPLYQALLWAIATFYLPLIVLPLYWVFLLFKRPQLLSHIKWGFIVPFAYLGVILLIAGAYKYFDDRSVDAHLARATNAKIRADPLSAINEYREALKIEDAPHTHKLLAATLEEAGLYSEAINEYRAAERGGEPDDFLHYKLGVLLERLNQRDEALIEFKKFVSSDMCLHADQQCDDVRQKIAAQH